MNEPSIDYGFWEKLGGLVYRPSLHLSRHGDRKDEIVGITSPQGQAIGQSKYIRVWTHNSSGPVARSCRVFVQKIWCNDRLIENEQSPLQWVDSDAYVHPFLRSGFEKGHYVNVCACDSTGAELRIVSEKGAKGYPFSELGNYRIELLAESANRCWLGRILLTIKHDGNWKNLHVCSFRENRRFLPWRVGI